MIAIAPLQIRFSQPFSEDISMKKPAWHIHVDAQVASPEFETYVASLGFVLQNFLHHDAKINYAPACHLTVRPKDTKEFKDTFAKVRSYITQHAGSMTGYMEGEFIPYDLDISETPFDPTIKLPLRVSCANLPPGKFREDEIHVSLLRDESDPRLLQALADMGLYVGYLLKPAGVAAIFTVQGSRTNISALFYPLKEYLEHAGVEYDAVSKRNVLRTTGSVAQRLQCRPLSIKSSGYKPLNESPPKHATPIGCRAFFLFACG